MCDLESRWPGLNRCPLGSHHPPMNTQSVPESQFPPEITHRRFHYGDSNRTTIDPSAPGAESTSPGRSREIRQRGPELKTMQTVRFRDDRGKNRRVERANAPQPPTLRRDSNKHFEACARKLSFTRSQFNMHGDRIEEPRSATLHPERSHLSIKYLIGSGAVCRS